MSLLAQNRNSGEIQSISGGRLKGADASLAENYIGISLCHDVFGGIEPLVDGGGKAAF